MSRRAVVTGLGIVAPTGIGIDAYWAATLAGKTAIRPVAHLAPGAYPVRLGGVVEDFVAEDHLPGGLVAQTDRWTAMGLTAAAMALDDAGIDPPGLGRYDLGVVTGSSSGGNEFGQREIQRLWAHGPRHVGAYQSIAWFYAATTGQISIRHGGRGPCGVFVAEQAAGLDALGQARRLVRSGSRAVLSGGTEAPMSPFALVCQLPSGRLSRSDDAERGYLPFDVAASGHVPGEGGAMLMVEERTAAHTRGAFVYGEIAGYASTFDPRPGSGRPPGLRRAIDLALADAGMRPGEVDVVFADAAADPGLDRAEAAALAAVFGPHGVPVAAPKTTTGRLYAGGSALDVATALLAVRDSVIPPATGVTEVSADCPVDLVVGEPRAATLRSALVLARGFGGFNSALLVRIAE
jgi:act minimal PKS chain-length factor (CLF/KS beta)